VSGVVRAVRPRVFTTQIGPPPGLSNAAVTVVSGRATGQTTTTDAMGNYGLNIPEGVFQLRFSRPGYVSATSLEQRSAPDGQLTMPDVTLATASWAVSGIVSDSRGTAIPAVLVTVDSLSGRSGPFGSVMTDPNGRYRLTSTGVHFDTIGVSAGGTNGLVPKSVEVPCCNPPEDSIADLRLTRVALLTPHAPGSLRVGEQVEMPPVDVVYDDGTSTFIYILPTSSAPTTVAVDRGQRGFVVRGVQVGSTTLTFDLHGAHAVVPVRVVE